MEASRNEEGSGSVKKPQQQQRAEKSPTTGGSWAEYTIKGEINETKPTILNNIYLHILRLWRVAKVPNKFKKFQVSSICYKQDQIFVIIY